MSDWLAACKAGLRLELRQLNKARLLVVLTIVEAVTFLCLVSLFGLTGAKAPTALVDLDHGPLAAAFIRDLQAAHHSFRLEPMSFDKAQAQIAQGNLVAIITIPAGFSSAIAGGQTVSLPVVVDNVDADLTDDIQRALPAAVAAFGKNHALPGIRVEPVEHDLINHDTGYIPYLVVSALALDALVVGGVLAATAMAQEYEDRTVVQWRLSPASPSALLVGKLLATVLVSTGAVWLAAGVVFFGYGVHPQNMVGTLGALALCTVIFAAVGACVGNALKKTLPVATLFFGLALPLYIDSGSLEPERFDGGKLWLVAHLTPVYAAVGVLQKAVHGFAVTPEPVAVDLGVLVLWAVAALAQFMLQRSKAVTR